MSAANLTSNPTIELLQNRHSANNKKLSEPAPSAAQLASILQCAMSAPDHGRLQPWRYLYIQGVARQRLGDVFAAATVDSANAKGITISADKLAQMRAKPMRAPLIIVAIACLHPQSAVPRDEQLMSAACGAQQLQLAAESLGFASIWLSGQISHASLVRSALKLAADEQIIGFLYMGTRTDNVASKHPAAQQFCQEWLGEDA